MPMPIKRAALPVAPSREPEARVPAATAPRDLHLRRPTRRNLTLTFGRIARGMPMVLLAVSAPAGGCYLSHTPEHADGGTDARVVRPDAGPRPDVGPPPLCWGGEERFTVEIPEPGVPADASLICVSPGAPISNEAARVELEPDSRDRALAHGTITIDAGLLPSIVGTPAVEIGGGFGLWSDASIGPVTRDGDVFRFDVRFPYELVELMVDSFSGRTELVTRFDLVCADGTTKIVQATTVVHACVEDDGTTSFASSGEECRTCAIIAEMAPTPIIPAERPDALPLQQGMQLSLRTLARFDNAVVLLAEHGEGAVGVHYQWHATGGELHCVEDDVAVWELPAPDRIHAVQVVVQTPSSAAVATFRAGDGL